MKAAAIYARVSSAHQAKDGTSLTGQVELCRQHAEANGYTVIKEIAEDISGARRDRPGLDQVLDMAERGELAALVVFDPDRLSRNYGQMYVIMEQLEKERVELIFVNAPSADTPEGNMLFGMRTLFAQYERDKILERTRRGKRSRLREGKIMGTGMAPYGYRYVKGEYRYVVEPDEAAWVQRMFDWLVNDRLPMLEIARRLNAEKVPPARGGHYWQPSTLPGIFKNTVYSGTWHWGKTEAVKPRKHRSETVKPKYEKSSRIQKDQSEWYPIEVPAIVSKEVQGAAIAQLARNRALAMRNTKNPYLLRGLIRCAGCGRGVYGRMSRTNKNQQLYYSCGGKESRLPVEERCHAPYINGSKLEEDVWAEVVRQAGDQATIEANLRDRERHAEAEHGRTYERLAGLHAAEMMLEREDDKMLSLFKRDVIEERQLERELALSKKKRQDILAERADLTEQLERRQVVHANRETIQRYCALVHHYLHRFSFEDKREFLEALEIRLLHDGKKVHMTGLISERTLFLFGRSRAGEEEAAAYALQRDCQVCHNFGTTDDALVVIVNGPSSEHKKRGP